MRKGRMPQVGMLTLVGPTRRLSNVSDGGLAACGWRMVAGAGSCCIDDASLSYYIPILGCSGTQCTGGRQFFASVKYCISLLAAHKPEGLHWVLSAMLVCV